MSEITTLPPEIPIIALLIAVPTFLCWRWLFKKTIQTAWVRQGATWGATLVSVPLLYIAFIVAYISVVTYYPDRDFNREKWIADQETRYEYARDIIESKMLMGKTKAEVRELLGDDGHRDTSDYWPYYLGFRPGLFNLDPDVLVIEFKEGKVVNVQQHET